MNDSKPVGEQPVTEQEARHWCDTNRVDEVIGDDIQDLQSWKPGALARVVAHAMNVAAAAAPAVVAGMPSDVALAHSAFKDMPIFNVTAGALPNASPPSWHDNPSGHRVEQSERAAMTGDAWQKCIKKAEDVAREWYMNWWDNKDVLIRLIADALAAAPPPVPLIKALNGAPVPTVKESEK